MLKVGLCKGLRCPHLHRRSTEGLYNNGPFYCSKDKRKSLIREMGSCPKKSPFLYKPIKTK